MYNDDKRKTWNTWASRYETLINTTEKSYMALTHKIIETIEYTDSILELGAGTGSLSLSLSPYCREIDAIDYSEHMIRKAWENKSFSRFQNVNFMLSSAEHIQCKDNSYDIVILSNTMHVLDHPQEVMAEIKRVLKPGGRLIAPNLLHKEKVHSRLIIKALGSMGYPVVRTFDENSYYRFLEKHGFTLHKNSCINGFVPMAYVEATLQPE